MLKEINVIAQCRDLKVGIWACPHFLFIIMGFLIVIAIMATNLVAKRYAEPEIAALAVLIVTTLLFIISHIIVKSFEQVALASRAKAEFISIVSHQLRNPLTSIKWYIQSIQPEITKLSPAFAQHLETINSHNEEMMKLVNTLLEVNRIEDNRVLLQPSRQSLPALTKRSLDDFKDTARQSGHTLTLDLHTPNIPDLFFDETRIRWVIDNLTSNAIRYATANTPICITIEDRGDSVFWSVNNEGDGIPTEDAKRIFEKFFRGTYATKLQTEGSGLGLFIAKSIIEASGGHIGFHSKEHQEATFWFTLPHIRKTTGQRSPALTTNTHA